MKKYLFILCLFIPSALFGHPHAFVDCIVTFQFNPSSLGGFWIEWKFDELFSAEAILYFDKNNDGTFNDKEQLLVKQGASGLNQYGYYTYITYKGKTRMVSKVEKFSADIRNHRLIYRFFIPLNLPRNSGQDQIIIAIYDKVFYADFDYVDSKPVRFIGIKENLYRFTIKKSKRVVHYNNFDTFGGRSGQDYSGEAFPKEIILHF